MKIKQLLIAIPMAFSCSVALSQTYIDQIATMEAQIELLNKQIALNEAIAKASESGATTLPKVISVIIDNEGASAEIYYSSGRVRTVSSGDSLTKGVSVTAVTQAGVAVKTLNGEVMLSFHNPLITQQKDPVANLPSPPKVNIPTFSTPASSVPVPTLP